MSTFEHKNSLRAIKAQIVQKLKNNEARPKFTGSYKKKVCSGSDIVLNEIDDVTDGADFILTHARFEQQKYRQ